MNEKKNIDKLFKEQLKNFEETPKDHLWDNIEERLHEDKRKKRLIIPIWWKIAGIAAGIILLFTVANQVFNNSVKDGISNDIIVDDSNSNKDLNPQNENNTLGKDKSSDDLIENQLIEDLANTNSETSIENDENASVNKNKSTVINTDNKDHSVIASDNSNQLKLKEKSQYKKTSNSSNNFEELLEEKRTPIETPLSKDAVANNTTNTPSETNKNSQDLFKDKSELNEIIESTKTDSNTTVAKTDIKETSTSDTENNPVEDLENKKEEEETTNAIENAIAEAEETNEKEEEEEKLNRWSVAPNVAPVYFSSLGEGSSLDNQFIENTKESEINMSYGINGSYAVNKKIKIRAGINRVQLGYQTNDVLIFENTDEFASRNSNQMDNLEMATVEGRYSIYSANSFKFENAPATLFTQEQGSIDQQLGFIEVPVEIEYNLIERKVGLNLIGGFSALFLNENDVFAVFNNGERARLGEASNVKDLSYSANFGIGLDYNFSKQFQFNLEPTFKYQINTFNNTSGDFNPFFIGLYTGLSFKF